MDWDSFWNIIGCISDILGIISVVISFALWLSFGKFKKEIKLQLLDYAEKRQSIYENLDSICNSIFKDNLRDEDIIGQLRQQLYIIDRHFGKLERSGFR